MASPFPTISRSYILSCQFSSWYPAFASISPRATIIRPLSAEFRQYLQEDGVVVPDGSDDISLSGASGSDTDDEDDDADTPQKRYSFPELDAQIRNVIVRYGAVFPKLNWTSPRDASWILPTLRCTSPMEIYLLLKSSDFILHDLEPSTAFEGCSRDVAEEQLQLFDLELVLKKWYAVDHGREFRCFIRENILLGISQRYPNYHPHLNEEPTKTQITSTILNFWVKHIKSRFEGGSNYIFDVHLTRDLSSAHLLDFNPYHPKTDSLLFTYNELLGLFAACQHNVTVADETRRSSSPFTPMLRVIDSPSDPAAIRNSPANNHNAIPFDVLHLSAGADANVFANRFEEELRQSFKSDTNSDTA